MLVDKHHSFPASFLNPRRWLTAVTVFCLMGAGFWHPSQAQSGGGSITLRADVQEADANTGIVTARGNVRIDYPEEAMYATSAQAQYYSRERRIVLTGNVFVQQEANTLQAEVVTYLIDEGRFVATPNANEQVESVYVLPEPAEEPAAAPEPEEPATNLPVLPEALPSLAIPTDE